MLRSSPDVAASGASLLTPEGLSALPPTLARRRELGPLFYTVFAAAGRLAELPDAAQRRAGHRATMVRNLAALDRLAAILDAAEAAGLTLLPLKGSLFATWLYPDPAARPMADLDLAVQPSELAAAVACLTGLGFHRCYGPRARFSPRHGHDVAMTDGGTYVELHYRLLHELGADGDVAPLFAHAGRAELFGRARAVPSLDDHLLFVAVHAATHSFGEHPAWLIDSALLIERGARVERAAEEASRRRMSIAFAAALALAHAALPRFIPAPGGDARLARRLGLLARVLGPDPLARPPRRLPSLLARAVLTDEPRVALREIARKLELRAIEVWERTFSKHLYNSTPS